jgi:hypothetical protein
VTNLFQVDTPVDSTQINAVTTGHVAQVMAWEDGPNGRRPGSTPELDEATGAPFQVIDVMLPLGRDERPELFGVRFASHEVPDLPAYSPVELVGLRMKVRGSRQGKGVDVTFTAEAVRPAGPQRTGRKTVENTNSEAA